MIYLIIPIFFALAIFAFTESQNQKKLRKRDAHPDFKPMKLDEEKINNEKF